MVGVASSNLVAPTKFGRKIKHLAVTPGAFFRPYAQIERISVTFPPLACTLRSTSVHASLNSLSLRLAHGFDGV